MFKYCNFNSAVLSAVLKGSLTERKLYYIITTLSVKFKIFQNENFTKMFFWI
jgi:hypothetical protein